MKIAVIAPNRIPARSANTIQVMKMAQAFSSLGHQVEVVYPSLSAPNEQPGTSWDELAAHYGLQYRFPIVNLASNPRLRKYDYAWRSVQRVHATEAELVYTRLLQAAALASLGGIPTILELHDLPTGWMGPVLFKLFLRGRGRRRLVLISTALKMDICRLFNFSNAENLIRVAPDGVDLSRYAGLLSPDQARKSIKPDLLANLGEQGLPFDAGRFTAGYSGHLYPGRGVGLMLELAERLPDLNFLIMGGEPDEVSDYRQLAAGRALKNLVLTGFIPNAELPRYQAACDVLLMPYQHKVAASSGGDISRYLSPMKLFEYLASGRAILSSDLPVFREVLSPDVALLLPPDSLERWVAALLQLKADDERRRELGRRARQKSGIYSWEVRAANLLAGLPGILAPGRSD